MLQLCQDSQWTNTCSSQLLTHSMKLILLLEKNNQVTGKSSKPTDSYLTINLTIGAHLMSIHSVRNMEFWMTKVFLS